MLNEKTKKILKIIGVVVAVFFFWSVFNSFTGRNNQDSLTSKYSSIKRVPQLLNQSITEDAGSSVEVEGRPMPMNVTEENFIESRQTVNDEVSSTELVIDEKVIKNGDLGLKVENTEKAAEKVSVIAKEQGGEVFATNFYERVKGQKSGNITIKVPVNKFEETIAKLKKVATQVISESTTGQDVTEQYADLQAQLKNKRAEEESFVKILDRAGKIDDVLAVTQQISRVRGQIERLEGRIRYMDSQTDMSTININLSEDIEIASTNNDWRPWQVVKRSAKELLSNIQDFVDGIIRFVIVGIPSLIPFLLFLLVLYWIGKRIYRKIRN
jgi:hypothetical protein